MMWEIITFSSIFGSVAVQAASILKGVQGHGKYITIPMLKIWALWYLKRLLRKKRINHGDSVRMTITPIKFRFWQWCVLFGLIVWASILDLSGLDIPSWVFCCVYWWPWSLLHADDLLTLIDKDKWSKRWKAAKNKIKWRMELPVPVRA